MKIYLQSHELFEPEKQRWLKQYAPMHYEVKQEREEQCSGSTHTIYTRFFVDLPDDIATLYMLKWAQ